MTKVKLSSSPNLILNSNIKTIDFVLIFPTKYKVKNEYNLDILKLFLNNYSAKYPNEKEFSKELSKRFIMNYCARSKVLGDNLYIRFELTVPEEGIIPEYNMEEAFSFFVETIYNPLIDKEGLEKKQFAREKEFVEKRFMDSNKSIYNQSFNNLIELIDPEEKVFTHFNTSLKYLKRLNAKECLNYYKSSVISNDFISYVYGNFDEEKIKYLFNKYLPRKEEEVIIDLKYDKLFHPGDYKYEEKTSNFNQTALYMVYDVMDFKAQEKEYLTLIANILGGSENDLIFKALRLEHNLVYSSSVLKYPYRGLFIVETYLSYDNKDKAIKLIKETIEKLKNKEFLENSIKRLLKGMEVDMLYQSDSKYAKLDNKIAYDLHLRPIEKIYQIYKDIDIDSLIVFINRINLNTIYVLRGDKND